MGKIAPHFLFHVTPASNLPSIKLRGLDPRVKFPMRIDTRSWFVSFDELMWAIAHTGGRFSTSTDNLAVFAYHGTAWGYGEKFKALGMIPGLWFSPVTGMQSPYRPKSAYRLADMYGGGTAIEDEQFWSSDEETAKWIY